MVPTRDPSLLIEYAGPMCGRSMYRWSPGDPPNAPIEVSHIMISDCLCVDTPSRRRESSIVDTQPTSADTGDSATFDTPADIGWVRITRGITIMSSNRKQ